MNTAMVGGAPMQRRVRSCAFSGSSAHISTGMMPTLKTHVGNVMAVCMGIIRHLSHMQWTEVTYQLTLLWMTSQARTGS